MLSFRNLLAMTSEDNVVCSVVNCRSGNGIFAFQPPTHPRLCVRLTLYALNVNPVDVLMSLDDHCYWNGVTLMAADLSITLQ